MANNYSYHQKKVIKFLIPLLLLGVPLLTNAQYNRHWCIGDSLRLDFISSPPSIMGGHPLKYLEAGTTISSKQGNLLFYVNHDSILNYNNELMENGDSLQVLESNTQGLIVIPKPLGKNQYYLISYGQCDFLKICLNYSEIDLNENNGLGKVILKKEPISIIQSQRIFTEKIYGIKHANGEDWWIILHEWKSNKFILFLADSSGLNGPFYQSIGETHGLGSLVGQMVSTLNGDKIAVVSDQGIIEVFEFNRCTGKLDNPRFLGDRKSLFYGCSFSPSGQYLYVSDATKDTTKILRQFDLNAPNPIQSQIQFLFTSIKDDWPGQHLLALDGKIYISHHYGYSLNQSTFYPVNQLISVIHHPDSPGISCDFQPHSLDVRPYRTSAHLPNLPNFELGPLPRPPAEAGPDRIVGCESDSTSIGSPGLPGYLYIWQPATGLSNANSPQPRAGVTATTRYVLTVIDSSRSCENVSTDTVTISLRPPTPIALDAGPDRQGCPGQALGLGGDAAPHWTYQWNPTAGLSDPATSHPSLRTTRSQTYTLRVTDTSGTCPRVGLDSVSITIGSPQLAEAGPDISQCDGISMRDTLMALPIEGASYRWTPSLGLSDPSLARPVVSVSQSQKYQLEVTVDTFCISRDSVLVRVEPCTQVIAPNAFSPNGDGINETFRITNLPPGSILEVWNRWGRRVYQNAHYDNSWQAENLPEGVYVWWLKTPQGETLTGTVTVIR